MELIDALHLRGWRPFALALLVAAGAVVGALIPQDTAYTSQHIVFAAQLAADDLSPAQVEDFASELRLAATLPQVRDNVEALVGTGDAAAYTVDIAKTQSDTSIQITAEAASEEVARQASKLTGEESARFVIGQSIDRADSLVVALEDQLEAVREEQQTLTDLSGGIDPQIAVTRASELLFDSRQEAAAGDVEAGRLADSLEEEIDLLRPLQQDYILLEQEATQIADELGQAITDRSRAQNALDNATNELVIAERSTRETSKVPARAQNMLLLATLNALLLVAVFIGVDRIGDRRRGGDPEDEADGPQPATTPVVVSTAKAPAAATAVTAATVAAPARPTAAEPPPRLATLDAETDPETDADDETSADEEDEDALLLANAAGDDNDRDDNDRDADGDDDGGDDASPSRPSLRSR